MFNWLFSVAYILAICDTALGSRPTDRAIVLETTNLF